ncbi:hypothetical protein HDU76_007889, partial [Blyttiomyces sp. JEL0837]
MPSIAPRLIVHVFDVSWGRFTYDEEMAVLDFINVCKPKQLSVRWHPLLIGKLIGVKALFLHQNRNNPLKNFSDFGNVAPSLLQLHLVDSKKEDLHEETETVMFDSLFGIDSLVNLKILHIQCETISNFEENVEYLKFPNLVQLHIHDRVDVTTFLEILRKCPSLEIFHTVQLTLRLNEDFCLQCENASKGSNGVTLRNTFHGLKELRFQLSEISVTNLM